MNVSVVIPNWNGISLLEKNLPEVIKAKENKKNSIDEIIIVDDHSTDSSVSYLRKNFKEHIKLIVHTKNRGFSSSVNTGVRTAKNPLVCLLNTDVIPDQKFLENVIPHFKDDKVFAVSLHEKGYGYAVSRFENGYLAHAPGKESTNVKESLWASGGSSVFRRSIWMQLKGMDEELYSPFYWEDIDLGYRAHKRRYKILWEPTAHVVHKHESVINSNNFRNYWLNLIKERNQLVFTWKNLTSKRLMKKHIRGLLNRTLHHPGYLKVVFFALLKYPLIRKRRKIEKKEAKVSDEALIETFSK